MGNNQKFTLIAVALLSAAVTFLICYGQIRTAEKRAAILQKQADAARADRDWAFFRGQHSSLTQWAQMNAMQTGLNALQKSAVMAFRTGPGHAGLPLEAMRRSHARLEEILPGTQGVEVALFPGLAIIAGTEYDLPPSYKSSATGNGQDVTVKLTGHTLVLRHEEMIWDGVDFGNRPARGRVQITAGGRVLVNGALRMAHVTR